MVVATVHEKMTALANAIRAYSSWSLPMSLDDMEREIHEVHNIGKQDGVFEDWNRRWEIIQNNGIDINDSGLFAGHGWKDEIFEPKYDLDITNANQMFWSSGLQDLIGCLERAGVSFTTHRCTNFTGTFSYSKLTRIPFVDMTLAKTSTNNVFSNCTSLEYIAGIRVNSANTALSNIFTSCSALKHVVFSEDSQINSNINLSAAKYLDYESMESIRNALYASTTTRTLTFSTYAVDLAFAPDFTPGSGVGVTSQDWIDFIASKPSNWNIGTA